MSGYSGGWTPPRIPLRMGGGGILQTMLGVVKDGRAQSKALSQNTRHGLANLMPTQARFTKFPIHKFVLDCEGAMSNGLDLKAIFSRVPSLERVTCHFVRQFN